MLLNSNCANSLTSTDKNVTSLHLTYNVFRPLAHILNKLEIYSNFCMGKRPIVNYIYPKHSILIYFKLRICKSITETMPNMYMPSVCFLTKVLIYAHHAKKCSVHISWKVIYFKKHTTNISAIVRVYEYVHLVRISFTDPSNIL